MNKSILITKLNNFAENFSFVFSSNEINNIVNELTQELTDEIDSNLVNETLKKIKTIIKERIIKEFNKDKKGLFNKIDKCISDEEYDEIKKIKLISSVFNLLNSKLSEENLIEILNENKKIEQEITVFLRRNKDRTIYIDKELLSMYKPIEPLLQTYIKIKNITISENKDEDKSLLTYEQVKDLYKRMRHGDKNAKDELIIKNMGLARKVAYKYLGRGIEYDDLYQEGLIGLQTAVEKYNPELGYAFSTYATWYIKQRMQRYIDDNSSTIRLPVHKRQVLRNINKRIANLERKLGKTPNEYELMAAGLTKEEIEEYKILSRQCTSIEQKVNNSKNEESSELGDFIPDPKNEYVDLIDKISISGLVEDIRKILKEREFNIICLRNGIFDGKEHTLEEIGEKYGLTRERIRQLEAKAYKKLINNKKINQYTDDLNLMFELRRACNHNKEIIEYIRLKIGLNGTKKHTDEEIAKKMKKDIEYIEILKQRAIELTRKSTNETIKKMEKRISAEEPKEETFIIPTLKKENIYKPVIKPFKEKLGQKYNPRYVEEVILNLDSSDIELLKKRYGENLDEVLELTDKIALDGIKDIFNNKIPNIITKIKLKEYFPNIDIEPIFNLLTEYEKTVIRKSKEKNEIINKIVNRIIEKINETLNPKKEEDVKTNMKKAKTFREMLSDTYSETEIKFILENLTDEDKEFLRKKYGENFDQVIKIEDKKVLGRINYILYTKIPSKVKVKKEQVGTEAIGIKTRKTKSFIDYIKGKYNEEEVQTILTSLTDEEKMLLAKKYGENFDNNGQTGSLDNLEKGRLNALLYIKIPKRITKQKEEKIATEEQQIENKVIEETNEAIENVVIEDNEKTEETFELPQEEKYIEEEQSVYSKIKPALIEIRDALNSMILIISDEEKKKDAKRKIK